MSRGGIRLPLKQEKTKRILNLYQENTQLTVKDVAMEVGCAPSTAWNVLVANGVDIRGGARWLQEKAHTHLILRRWDAGQSSLTISRKYQLQREGVARVIVANRPFDRRLRQLLRSVFGERAESRTFLNTIPNNGNTGHCAICRRNDGKLVKDYRRERDMLRDLLCRRCRQALGCFGDDPANVLRAFAYLIKHSDSPA